MSVNPILLAETSSADWNSFKEGNWSAYNLLYKAHFKILNNYGYKFTKDISLIEDSVHDLFVNLWTKRTQLGNPVSVKNYLYKALRNIIFRKIKTQTRFVNVDHDADYPFHFEVSFDHQFIKTESERVMQEQMKNMILTLPPRQREIIFLRFYEGMGYEEIADIMNLNANSTYKLLYKALNKLQDHFKMKDVLLLLGILWCQSVNTEII